MNRIYLDWNATAPLRPEAREAALAAFAAGGNPSSIHAEGREARRIRENSRDTVAGWLGVDREAVTFTSGGTESNVLALTALARARPGQPAFVSAAEHPSVLETARQLEKAGLTGRLTLLPVRPDGVLDLEAAESLLKGSDGAFISVQAANNETGALHPVHELSAVAKREGIPLHVDATQVPGRVPVPQDLWAARLVTFSGHKIGALPGTGILVDPERMPLSPVISGGPQERGRRAGTENLPGIASFAAAVEALKESGSLELDTLATLNRRFMDRLPSSGLRLTTGGAPRLPNTWSLRLGVPAEPVLQALDLEGIAVSSGSACSSGSVEPSPVLLAMGFSPDEARSVLRVSAGRLTAETDLDRFFGTLERVLKRAR